MPQAFRPASPRVAARLRPERHDPASIASRRIAIATVLVGLPAAMSLLSAAKIRQWQQELEFYDTVVLVLLCQNCPRSRANSKA